MKFYLCFILCSNSLSICWDVTVTKCPFFPLQWFSAAVQVILFFTSSYRSPWYWKLKVWTGHSFAATAPISHTKEYFAPQPASFHSPFQLLYMAPQFSFLLPFGSPRLHLVKRLHVAAGFVHTHLPSLFRSEYPSQTSLTFLNGIRRVKVQAFETVTP